MGDARYTSPDNGQERTRKAGGNSSERTAGKHDPKHRERPEPDRVMNQPNGSPADSHSAGLGQTGQSAERSRGANPDQPPGTPATQPPVRTVNTQPGEPYNDDTESRH